jgi:uncharacterized membrane protein YphA (DoxX/SURF4 family)
VNRGTKIALILLRIAIGWHFLYEGVSKWSVEPWQRPFSSEPYLQASIGPFRGAFRGLISDKDGLARLKKESIEAAIDRRHEEILEHYSGVKPFTDAQKSKLKATAADLKASLAARLDDPDFLNRLSENENKLNDAEDQLIDASRTPEQRAAAQKMRDEARKAIAKAVGRPATLWDKSLPREDLHKAVEQAGEESRFRQRVADYQLMLARVKEDASLLHAPFTSERLNSDRAKLAKTRMELLAIATAPLVELDAAAQKLADIDQMKAGPLDGLPSQTCLLDWMTAWGLTAIGLGLIFGVFTRTASLAAAAFLAMFYLAMPPWPGVPEPSLSEGHYFLVNKNLIEMIAVLALASLPTGHWFGLDPWAERHVTGPLRRRWRGEKARPPAGAAGKQPGPARAAGAPSAS